MPTPHTFPLFLFLLWVLSFRLGKVLSPVGVVNRIELPMNEETGKTAGFCFVEFATKDQAIEAKASCDGYRLDKKHVFTINNMSDFDKYVLKCHLCRLRVARGGGARCCPTLRGVSA